MKQRRSHRRLFWTLGVIGLVLFVLVGTWWGRNHHYLTQTRVQDTKTPTLFIPGYMGNKISFGGMIRRMDHYGIGTKAMVIHVSKQGKVQIDQQASLKQKNPLIQVLFQNNKQEHVEAKQLRQVLYILKEKYQVQKVNLVGHSSGGNIVFDYLTSPTAKTKQVPRVSKFVNIATNFPGNKTAGHLLPKQLYILNIAGDIWHLSSDGGIPVKQDLALKQIAAPHVAAYREVVVHGSPLTVYHSMLHENGAVDQIIAEYLFKPL
ncbi:alpha/beta hydrolase [Agrilactobacillus fermenti]|uniref:alpha/beta hydrolase n=1 Tax=Agrilactobacillus fermenti TaxID=2586909 RepID=UPI003A5BE3E3